MTDPAWALSGPIQGAIVAWKRHVEETNPIAEYPEKQISMDYSKHIGLKTRLDAEGYTLYWARDNRVNELIDLKGYERIVYTDDSGKEWVLAGAKDTVPLKKKK